MKDKINSGFTLIELLVVVAIIGILAAVGVVTFNTFSENAKKKTTQKNHKAITNFLAAEIVKCNNKLSSKAFDGMMDCPNLNAKSFESAITNSLQDKYKNPFLPTESAIWFYPGTWSGRAGWKPGATLISIFKIGGVDTFYITTCFEEQCYPTDPGPNPPVYGPGVLIKAIPIQ